MFDLVWLQTRIFAIALCAPLLLMAACSSENSVGSYVPIAAATTVEMTGLTTSTASGVDTANVVNGTLTNTRSASQWAPSVSQELFNEVERFYDSYLELRADVVDGSQQLSAIEDVVTATGRANVADASAYNEGLHADERLSAVNELWLFSNVETIVQLDDQTILVRDCTENQEVNSLDQFWITWTTNEVRIDTSTGRMLVADYVTTHNGFVEPDNPIGCAPISFRERAEVASAQVWTELAAWSRDPDARTEAGLSGQVGEPLRQRVLDAVVDSGTLTVNESREHSTFGSSGIDTTARLGVRGRDGIIVVVDSCHTFPDGRTGTDVLSQAAIADLASGAEQALRFHVLLDFSNGDRVDQVLAIDYVSDRCAQ